MMNKEMNSTWLTHLKQIRGDQVVFIFHDDGDLDQVDPKFKHSRINCRAYVQIPLDFDGINTSIDNQMLKTAHGLFVHLADLENRRNPDIGIF